MERQARPDNAETILDGLGGGGRPAPAPERIGAYRVEGRLGFGGMGEIFLAWDERLERRVAIKRIRQDAGLSPEQRERLRREARLAARLSHPAVVQIHDLISDGADDAIVMELIEGRTVVERLAAGRLETAEVLRLALEIAEGLAAAHEAGLVHRDLKAANVIITLSGHAKILDFGLACPVVRAPEDEGFTRQGVVLGTCHAMSPEQARGEEVDERSDLFSFGALVHEMLIGKPPFRGNDPIDSLRRVVTEEPADVCKARPDLPAEAVRLLRRLLAKDRDDRPASAREVIEILEHLRTAPTGPQPVAPEGSVSDLATGVPTHLDLPVRFHGKAGGARSFRWGRRRVLLVGAVAALVVAGAVALFMKTWSARPLRIAVIHPVVSAEDEDLALAAVRVHSATLRALTELQGITPLIPAEITTFRGAPLAVGKAVGAKQILSITLQRAGKNAQASFQLINVADGGAVWAEQMDHVPLGQDNPRELAHAVIFRVQKRFPNHARRSGIPEFDVRNEDYNAFLDIQGRVNAGGEVRREDLDRLEAIINTSPRSFEAQLLAARIAHSLYLSRRERADLDSAAAFAQRARILAPEDPRSLRQELQIVLTESRIEEAEAILEKLEELDPGDPEILPLRADLAEQQGNLDEAADRMADAVEQAPSWQNRYRLAFLEARRGRIDTAREQINAILEQSPDNIWAQEIRGHLELNYGGDLNLAEKIYRSLLPSIGERALGNLATISVMRGNYAEAAGIYNQALAVHPDSAYVLFNLAEVETELGEERQAEAHYRRALDRLTASEDDAELPPATALLKAQCLARLGRTQEAVAIAREELRKNPKDPGLLGQSTLVYSLAEERALAVFNAKAALKRGYQPRNFTGSALLWLRDVPELRPWFQKAG